MKNKNLYLIVGILTLLVFIGFLSETGPKDFFGYPINIWVFRLAYLCMTIFFFNTYFKMKKLEKTN